MFAPIQAAYREYIGVFKQRVKEAKQQETPAPRSSPDSLKPDSEEGTT
jgi:hypothetical protein